MVFDDNFVLNANMIDHQSVQLLHKEPAALVQICRCLDEHKGNARPIGRTRISPQVISTALDNDRLWTNQDPLTTVQLKFKRAAAMPQRTFNLATQ